MYPHEVVTVEISVPSSSGKSLQPSTDRGRLARAHISVPSSSGKSLQRIGSYRRRAGASISVPSSSGKSLQPTKSSTHFRLLSISVPSSSGKSLQHDLEFLTGEQWPDFSPLFIGEITSTRCATHQTTTILRFQSPLHRGNHFNVRLSCSPIRNPGISVPSSSGKSLQRRRWPWRWSYRPPFQSPLHRGNHFNVRLSVKDFNKDLISVPSSSGKSLQRRGARQSSGGNHISVPSSSGKSLQRHFVLCD